MNNKSLGLGKRLRKLREDRGYSQDYMANLLDITQPTYAKYESEGTDITVKRLQEIANIFEIEMSSLFHSEHRIINIQDNKDSSSNQYIENQKLEVSELYQKLIDNLTNDNSHLKEEINYLRKKVDELMKK